MKISKIINFLLSILIILFSILFALFFWTIYQDYNIQDTAKLVDISENQKEIKIAVEQKNETEVLEMEPPTGTKQSNEKNNNVNSNKFYYNQLDSYSKLIYESLEKQKENLKKGTETINLPEKIKDILEEENIEAILSAAINAFEYDNPDIYYIDMSKLVLYYESYSTGKYNIYLKKDEQYQNYLNNTFSSEEDIKTAQMKIDNIANEIQANIENMETDYDKILYIHDWITENIEYDETLNKTNRNDIYGAFIEKEVTCGGYAKAFKYLADKLNIDCIIIQGKATSDEKTENHAWNYIKLSNNWYGVDCTWDDPIIIGSNGNEKQQKYYTYFLKGKEAFNNHKHFETFWNTKIKINYPELSNNNYN